MLKFRTLVRYCDSQCEQINPNYVPPDVRLVYIIKWQQKEDREIFGTKKIIFLF